MQFQVPQFIDTEDKIVGPLSLRQFIYIGIGAGISALLYFILQTWLWAILSFFLVGGAIAISFVKIEGRPLPKIILSAFSFYWNPQTYVWQPEHPAVQKHKTPPEAKPIKSSVLEKIAMGMALHKSWEKVQVGVKPKAKEPQKKPQKKLKEQKVSGHYEIFRKLAGDREAARRVDYR
ncbi:MAG: PrgI family protein [Minisyncoccia bacterium]|jgi:hypothetical protein